MARDDDGRRTKRFTKSANTRHLHSGAEYPPGAVPPSAVPPGAAPPGQGAGFDDPSYHAASTPPAGRAAAASRAAAVGTGRAARFVTRKVIDASKADGAHESGLTALIWNQVLSYGTDAMITVALAGTVFFSASEGAQRGNVLLYLLVTMAPFAVVAPVIGPVLDRFQHGRRWAMAGSAGGRAVLALIMAGHPHDLLVLYPCALGSLVLSKAYSVLRAAAAPRLLPRGLTLTEANARLTLFGLGSTVVLGGFVGVVIKTTGSYTTGLVISAIGFATCAAFALRLPPQVDAAPPAPADQPAPAPGGHGQLSRPPLTRRLMVWARRGFAPRLVTAMQGEASLRFLAGLLTIYLAFYVESTQRGTTAAFQLGAVVIAAGAGNFTGTAIGTRLKLSKPERLIFGAVTAAAVTCLVVAVTFSIAAAVVGMYVSAVANALSKVSLDSLIQRDVAEALRSQAFARSETFLQLAWVFGAAVGVLLPSHTSSDAAICFVVAGALTGVVAAIVILRERALNRRDTAHRSAPPTAHRHPPAPAGPVGADGAPNGVVPRAAGPAEHLTRPIPPGPQTPPGPASTRPYPQPGPTPPAQQRLRPR